MVNDIALDGIEVARDILKFAVLRSQFVDDMSDGQHCDFAIQLVDAVPVFLTPKGQLSNCLLQFALKLLHIRLDLSLLCLRQLLEIVRTDDCSLAHGCDGEAAGGPHEHQVLGLAALLQLLEGGFLSALELIVDHPAAIAVVLALEQRGDRGLEVANELLHVRAQLDGRTGRQAQGDRPLRVCEVVDVAEIERRRSTGRRSREELTHHHMLPGARFSEDEKIVARALDADAEARRLDRAPLPR